MAKRNSSPVKQKRNHPRWIIGGLAAAVLLLIGAGAWTMRSAASPPVATARNEHPTMDPNRFFGPAREAYAIAAKDPALLAQLHCYCGCDKEVGHQNLLDCYRDEHGAHCPVCTGEALEAEKLADEGLPVDQIRRVLRDHYAQGN